MHKLLPKVCVCVYIYTYLSICYGMVLCYMDFPLCRSMANPWVKILFALSMNILYSLTHRFGKFCIQVDFAPLFPFSLLSLSSLLSPKSILLPPQQITFPLPPVSARQGQAWWILALPHRVLSCRTCLISACPDFCCCHLCLQQGSKTRGVAPWESLIPSRMKTHVGRKEGMEWIEGQEKGEEPAERQKAVMRPSVQCSNPSLSLASRHLSSCRCSGGGLAPSPCSWPQTFPSQPAPTRAGAKKCSTIPAPVQWDGEDALAPLSTLSPSLPILPALRWKTAQVCLVNSKWNVVCWPKPSMKILLICLMSWLQLQPDE